MKKLVFICIYLSLTIPCAAGTIYVSVSAAGANDGTSWNDAYNLLQDALDDSDYGDDIWVAEGTYYPSVKVGGTSNRYKTFQMKNGVAIYGGFPTGGSDFENRDPNQYETILSGDLLGDDNPTTPVEDLLFDPSRADNCYHVFYHPAGLPLDPNAILDGFTITAGNANGFGDHSDGSGMYNYESSPTVIDCTFTGNSAYTGGGMYNYSYSNPTVTNCSFTGNLAYDGGGGMRNYTSSPTVNNCTFTANSSGRGTVLSSGAGMYNNSSNPTVTNCTFTGNLADQLGGGMYNDSSSPIVTNCTFTGNSASLGGGMSNRQGSSPTVTNCTFTGNLAEEGNGGGMWNWESSPTVVNCTFTNNSAYYDGGGMCNWKYSSTTVIDCTFTGNSAYYDGGGMNNYKSSPTVTNCTFTDNSAYSGGGVYNSSGSPTLENCIITLNTAHREGGGMYNINSNPTITNCTFSENYTVDGGGGMCNKNSDPVVTDCYFVDNVCEDESGGAIYNYQSDAVITGCTFEDNITAEGGGAVANIRGSPVISDCTFTENTSEDDGGAVMNYYTDLATFDRCIFIGNSAYSTGGAVENGWYTIACEVIFKNCIFGDNTASRGGAVANRSSLVNATFINCTFSGNHADYDGGAMYTTYPSSATVTNCIFWDNEDDGGMDESAQITGSTTTVNNSCVQGLDTFSGNDNIDTDPLFVDTNNGDFHLSPGSPCIDAGDPNYQPYMTVMHELHFATVTMVELDKPNVNLNSIVVKNKNEREYALMEDYAIVEQDSRVLLQLIAFGGSFPDFTSLDGTEQFFVDYDYITPFVELDTDLDGNPRIIDGDGDGEAVVDMGAYEFLPSLEAQMKLTPQTLNCSSQGNWIKAHFTLPEEFGIEDVDTAKSATIDSLTIISDYINVFYNNEGLVEIEVAFSRTDFCSIGLFGNVELTVRGWFTDGTAFYGTDTIRITTNKFEQLLDFSAYWLQTDCAIHNFCDGFDLDHNGLVDLADFVLLAEN